MGWPVNPRPAKSLTTLLAEVNARWPKRDKASDGLLGDAEHASRDSDHNPWVKDLRRIGVVRALDVDSGPGLNPDEAHDEVGDVVAETARQAGKDGHPAMGPGSYVIHERHITSANSTPPWSWRPYNGADPHTSHPHISVTTEQSGYDSTKPWGVFRTKGKRKARPVLWMNGPDHPYYTRVLQRRLGLDVDGDFGLRTKAAVVRFRRKHKLRPARLAVVGPRAWRALLKEKP